MKNLVKEIGIIPFILVLIAIGVGAASIYNCNGICGDAGAECPGGSSACCDGLDCVGGHCCVPTGNTLAASAPASDCCSGSSRAGSGGAAPVCCATAGSAPVEGSCCDDLYWNLGTCYACAETGERIPAHNVPCCDSNDQLIGDVCTGCPCGWEYIVPDPTEPGGGPTGWVCECG